MFVEKSATNKHALYLANKVATPSLIEQMKEVLSDEVEVFFTALGYHWNVKGADFSQYHSLFEEIYEDVYSAIDPTAENILKLGGNAPFTLTEFMSRSSIPPMPVTTDPKQCAAALLGAHEQLLICLNKAFEIANNTNEQGVANFIAERIDMTQKWMWQLKSSISA